jgi:hypothetical protein
MPVRRIVIAKLLALMAFGMYLAVGLARPVATEAEGTVAPAPPPSLQ